jgi:hypothetical protein
MRITITRHAERHSVTPLKHGLSGRWHLVPTTYNGIGWTYHWEKVLPGDWRTKKEAVEAKRAQARGEVA